MWLTRAALRYPVLIAMVTLAVVILGLTSLGRLPIDLFPNINLPVVRVGTLYPGAGPEDIERTVTYPVEKAVASITNVEHVESFSKQGVSLVSVWLDWGANIESAMVEGTNKVQQTLSILPTGVQTPFIIKFDLSNIPVCNVTVSGGQLDERDLYDLAYNTIAPQLEQLPGVASATVNGGKIRQITVSVDRERMAAIGLSMLDVVRAINGANLIEPAGWIKVGARQYQVSTNSQIKVIERINDVVVAWRAGVPVRIGDLGVASDSFEEQTNVVRIDGRHGVNLSINKQPGTNTVETVDAVRGAIRHLIGVPAGVRLGLSFDQSLYIRESISALRHEALQGALLAFVVILIFLQNLRGTVIISLAIPLSILATFLLLYLTGQTLNIFTLGGLALAVGRMVDDSIVELENISRHFAAQGVGRRSVLDAAAEVAMPIFASTVTTVIVFLPAIFVSGIARILFIPIAVAVTCSLVASFFVSTTVTPLLCVRFLIDDRHTVGRPRAIADFCRRMLSGLEGAYRRGLEAALRHRVALVSGVLGAAALSALLIPYIGVEFFPTADESQFRVVMRAPIGTRLEETEKLVERLEAAITAVIPPEWIEQVQSNIGLLSTAGRASGRSATYSPNTGPHAAWIQVYLVSRERRSRSTIELVDKLRPLLERDFPGMHLYMDPGGIVKRVLNFGSSAPIDVELLGYDLSQAASLAKQVASIMKSTRGVADVQISREENFPEFDINIDRAKAALAGIYEYDAAHLILDSTNGSTQSPSVYIDPGTGNQYNIVARYDQRYRSNFNDLGDTFLINPLAAGDAARNQGVVRLRSIATIVPGAGPLEIDRKYLQRIIDITANPAGRDLGAIAGELEGKFAALKLPPGFSLRLGGQIAQQRGTFRSLGWAAALALMLVYMVLAAQFQSLMDPFVIMFSVPLGVVGVIWSLFLTGTTFSTTSFMGVIMMVGIVVSNGVLLVHYTNLLRARGEELHGAVIDAAVTRLRPILMTTVATLAGLLPMAIGLSVGSEANAPLARAVIGGLAVSTVLTLFFIPALYTFTEEHQPRRAGEPPIMS
jgi:CzcA family heavy metal efflux pump